MNVQSRPRHFSRDFDSFASTSSPRHRSIIEPRLFNQSGQERAAVGHVWLHATRRAMERAPGHLGKPGNKQGWDSNFPERLSSSLRQISRTIPSETPSPTPPFNFLSFYRRNTGHSQLAIFYSIRGRVILLFSRTIKCPGNDPLPVVRGCSWTAAGMELLECRKGRGRSLIPWKIKERHDLLRLDSVDLHFCPRPPLFHLYADRPCPSGLPRTLVIHPTWSLFRFLSHVLCPPSRFDLARYDLRSIPARSRVAPSRWRRSSRADKSLRREEGLCSYLGPLWKIAKKVENIDKILMHWKLRPLVLVNLGSVRSGVTDFKKLLFVTCLWL